MILGKCWLVGAGPMAIAHAAVQQGLGVDFEVIGRSKASARAFTDKTGLPVRDGGLERALASGELPEFAVVAIGVEGLAEMTVDLLKAGVKNVLVEKPAGMSTAEVEGIASLARERSARVVVGYNRRHFASVTLARKLIAQDGGLQSMTFDFTEMADRVGRQDRHAGVKARWLLANSTHVLDLAFHLAGQPVDWSAYRQGGLDWHPSGSIFSGAGTTDRGVAFSYNANWEGPGRWGLDLVTAKRRFVLRPMEVLQSTAAALVAAEPVSCDDHLDQKYKAGLFAQAKAFFTKDDTNLCLIDEHARRMPVYERIGGYSK